MANYYEILGVEPDATHNEIKKAYREAVQTTHPDHVDAGVDPGEAEERFARVQEAWNTLRNPKLRAEYDETRPEPSAGAPRRARTGPTAARGDEPVLDPRRKWWALAIAQVVAAIGWSAVVASLIILGGDDPNEGVANTLSFLGVMSVPASMVVVVKGTRSEGVLQFFFRANAFALGVAILSVVVLPGVLELAAMGAFAFGGAVGLGGDTDRYRRSRIWAAVFGVVYTLGFAFVSRFLSIALPLIAPFPLVGLADWFKDRREMVKAER